MRVIGGGGILAALPAEATVWGALAETAALGADHPREGEKAAIRGGGALAVPVETTMEDTLLGGDTTDQKASPEETSAQMTAGDHLSAPVAPHIGATKQMLFPR
jgi:hypothetical protein